MDFFENILGKDVYIPLDNGGARGKLEEKENFEFLCMKEYRDIKLEVLESRRLRRFSLVSWRIFFENILGKGYIPLDDGRVLYKNEIRNWKFWKVIDYVAFLWQVCEILSIRNKIGWLKGFFEERKYDSKIEIRKLRERKENLNDSNFLYINV